MLALYHYFRFEDKRDGDGDGYTTRANVYEPGNSPGKRGQGIPGSPQRHRGMAIDTVVTS